MPSDSIFTHLLPLALPTTTRRSTSNRYGARLFSPRVIRACAISALTILTTITFLYSTGQHRWDRDKFSPSDPSHWESQQQDGNLKTPDTQVGSQVSSSPYFGAFDRQLQQNLPLASTVFVPFTLTNCTTSMPAWYAPCIASRSALSDRTFGEEVVYPDFGIPLPIFANDAQRDMWVGKIGEIKDRAVMGKSSWGVEYMLYKSQHGQNFVIHDIDLTLPPSFDSWASDACMSPASRLGGMRLQPRKISQHSETGSNDQPNGKSKKGAILIHSPDSWSFQHFLDRVTHVLAQASHLTAMGSTSALTGRLPSGAVKQMWEMAGFADNSGSNHNIGNNSKGNGNKVVHSPSGTLSLDSFIYSCKAVLIHPYLSWRALEMIGVPWADTFKGFDTSTKNTIFYMSRSNGRASNGGRRVNNEDAVLSAISTLLADRGRNEKLVLFDADQHNNDMPALINTLSREALAIVGPHGGAMMNHRFAGPDTLVLEFLPTTWLSFINYEEASLLNQTYSCIITESVPSSNHDMVIDPEEVIGILSENLGKRRKDNVILTYQWLPE